MSVVGQTEKNSVRANVFRFALELGYRVMVSALRICATRRHRVNELRRPSLWLRDGYFRVAVFAVHALTDTGI
jgi:hypothetical protein